MGEELKSGTRKGRGHLGFRYRRPLYHSKPTNAELVDCIATPRNVGAAPGTAVWIGFEFPAAQTLNCVFPCCPITMMKLDFAPGLSIFPCIVGGGELICLLRDLSRRIGNGADTNSQILVAVAWRSMAPPEQPWRLHQKVIQFMSHPDLTKEARDEAKLVRKVA